MKYVLVQCNYFLKPLRQMNDIITMIYIPEHLYDCGEIIKHSVLLWRLFVIQKLTISCMIGFYVYKSLSFYNGCLETVHINNQRILNFVNICSKEVIVNTSYPSTINQID